MSQSVALFGAYGLSFVTVLAMVAPAALAGIGAGSSMRRPVAGVVLLSGVLVLCGIGGAVRVALAPSSAAEATVPGVRLRLVQANIDQRMKWDEGERLKILHKYLALSTQPGAAPITHLVWPETALPYFLSTDPELLRILGGIVPRGGLLLTGAVRATPPDVRPLQIWNSVHAIDDQGRIVATYDKVHLVPFGEYVPLRHILPIDKITPGMMDFSSGPGPRTLELPGLPPASPFICYEAIFPGALVAHTTPRAQWLLNVTNDAWFGDSAGPRQHFASARLRAIEEGLPLVRAANTGISAVVDPYGRELARLGLGREGVLDSPLPVGLSPTPYARLGDWALLILMAAASVLMLTLRRRDVA
jgi:apolipoprotein N-acyltransferase